MDAKIFRPSSKPGPRKELKLERLALSKEALNTYGTPRRSQIALASLPMAKVRS